MRTIKFRPFQNERERERERESNESLSEMKLETNNKTQFTRDKGNAIIIFKQQSLVVQHFFTL